MALGPGLGNAFAPWRAAPRPRHLRGYATFVKKDQLLRRDRAERREELFATAAVGFRVPFLGVEGLFF